MISAALAEWETGALEDKLAVLFDVYDTDSNGHLDESEVVVVVRTLKPNKACYSGEKIMQVWDSSGNKQAAA